MYIIHICFKFGHLRTTKMYFYCILKGLFCIGEGTNTWGHGGAQAILSGQFLGYMCWLVFSEKHNRLTCWFAFHIFLLDYGCMGVLLEYTNSKTNILTFNLLRSCNCDKFCSLFNVGEKVEV